MAQLASIASIAATAANVAQGIAQSRARNRADDSQAALLQAQAAERDRQRQALLEKTVASARARLSASGASPDSGSGAALIEGMQDEAASAGDADQQQLAARLAAGRRSLLDDSGTLTAFSRAMRGSASIGSGLRSLLDVF